MRKMVANIERYRQERQPICLMHLFIYFFPFLFDVDYRVSMHVALCNEIIYIHGLRVAKHSKAFF